MRFTIPVRGVTQILGKVTTKFTRPWNDTKFRNSVAELLEAFPQQTTAKVFLGMTNRTPSPGMLHLINEVKKVHGNMGVTWSSLSGHKTLFRYLTVSNLFSWRKKVFKELISTSKTTTTYCFSTSGLAMIDIAGKKGIAVDKIVLISPPVFMSEANAKLCRYGIVIRYSFALIALISLFFTHWLATTLFWSGVAVWLFFNCLVVTEDRDWHLIFTPGLFLVALAKFIIEKFPDRELRFIRYLHTQAKRISPCDWFNSVITEDSFNFHFIPSSLSLYLYGKYIWLLSFNPRWTKKRRDKIIIVCGAQDDVINTERLGKWAKRCGFKIITDFEADHSPFESPKLKAAIS
jgi:uncharacterized membrane protein (DUF485 family)